VADDRAPPAGSGHCFDASLIPRMSTPLRDTCDGFSVNRHYARAYSDKIRETVTCVTGQQIAFTKRNLLAA
jgi:hypothetical protein